MNTEITKPSNASDQELLTTIDSIFQQNLAQGCSVLNSKAQKFAEVNNQNNQIKPINHLILYFISSSSSIANQIENEYLQARRSGNTMATQTIIQETKENLIQGLTNLVEDISMISNEFDTVFGLQQTAVESLSCQINLLSIRSQAMKQQTNILQLDELKTNQMVSDEVLQPLLSNVSSDHSQSSIISSPITTLEPISPNNNHNNNTTTTITVTLGKPIEDLSVDEIPLPFHLRQ